MTTFAAVRSEADGLSLVRTTAPGTLAAGQVRVRMLYAPVNPADLLTISGRYAFPTPEGTVLGAEGVGVVADVGSDVTRFAVGNHVLPLDRGNWCSERIVGEGRLVPVPAGTDPRRAALMRINPATAWLLLQQTGGKPGEIVAQNAARSSVAQWVRTFAAMRQISLVNLVRSGGGRLVGTDERPDEDAEIDRMGPLAVAALDCVAGEACGRLARLLMEGGQIVVFGHLSGDPVTVPSTLLTGRDLAVRGFSLRRAEAALTQEMQARMWADIWQAASVVQPEMRVTDCVSLHRLPEILRSAAVPEGRLLVDLSAA